MSAGAKVGARWWFFAGGWIVSDGLAVQEIARFPASARRKILRYYMGPRGPVAMLEARLRTSAMVAIGTLAISDNWANLTREFREKPERWVAVSLSIESTFGRQNNFGNPITVAIPLKGIAEWPLLQPLRYEHPLLLLLESTLNLSDDLVAGANKPTFMLRTESSVHSVSDSAMIAESLAREPNAAGLGRWLPACGTMLP